MSTTNQIHIFFKTLFDYNHKANQTIINAASSNKPGPAGNFLTLASEIVNLHHVWNCRIEDNQPTFSCLQLHALSDLAYIDKTNYFDSLLIIDQYDFDQEIEYTASTGGSYRNNTADLLFNIINQSSYLRGQIEVEFKRTGIEPTLTEYVIIIRGISNFRFKQNKITRQSLMENNYSQYTKYLKIK